MRREPSNPSRALIWTAVVLALWLLFRSCSRVTPPPEPETPIAASPNLPGFTDGRDWQWAASENE